MRVDDCKEFPILEGKWSHTVLIARNDYFCVKRILSENPLLIYFLIFKAPGFPSYTYFQTHFKFGVKDKKKHFRKYVTGRIIKVF